MGRKKLGREFSSSSESKTSLKQAYLLTGRPVLNKRENRLVNLIRSKGKEKILPRKGQTLRHTHPPLTIA